MQSRRRYLAVAASAALAGCGFTVETSTETSEPDTPLSFSTPAFEDGGTVPESLEVGDVVGGFVLGVPVDVVVLEDVTDGLPEFRETGVDRRDALP